MRAVVWHGREEIAVDTVPDPTIQEPTDAVVEVTSVQHRLRPLLLLPARPAEWSRMRHAWRGRGGARTMVLDPAG